MDATTGFHPTVECVDNGGPLDGLYLAAFSYDIARSVQRYSMGIYGLDEGETAAIAIMDYDSNPLELMNVTSNHGHGYGVDSGKV